MRLSLFSTTTTTSITSPPSSSQVSFISFQKAVSPKQANHNGEFNHNNHHNNHNNHNNNFTKAHKKNKNKSEGKTNKVVEKKNPTRRERRCLVLNSVAKNLGIQSHEQWYSITVEQFCQQCGGKDLVGRYGNSIEKLLLDLIPQYNWKRWLLLDRIPFRYWSDRRRRLEYLRWLEGELNIQRESQWLHVRLADLRGKKASCSFLAHYKNSLKSALIDLLPHYQWQSWRFDRASKGFWVDDENARSFLKWASHQLNVMQMSDWLQVTNQQLKSLKGTRMLTRVGGLYSMLNRYFPEYSWEKFDTDKQSQTRLVAPTSKSQLFLFKSVQSLFPSEEILSNFRKSRLRYKRNNASMEFDIFIPSLSLIIEFHGGQHYHWHFRFGSPSRQREKDEERKQVYLQSNYRPVG